MSGDYDSRIERLERLLADTRSAGGVLAVPAGVDIGEAFAAYVIQHGMEPDVVFYEPRADGMQEDFDLPRGGGHVVLLPHNGRDA